MTNPHPLKSVISLGLVDDTSLALPSKNQFRSGQQRVLEQVQTIRRTKSKTGSSSRTGSTSQSPTSPSYDSVFLESVKSPSASSNGNHFFTNGFTKSSLQLSQDKTVTRHMVNNSKGLGSVKKNMAASTYLYDRSYPLVGSMALASQTHTSRSEPEIAWQRCVSKRSAPPPQRIVSTKSIQRSQRPTSQFITNTLAQPKSPTSPVLQPLSPPPAVHLGNGHTKTSSQVITTKTITKTASKPVVTESAAKSQVDSGVNLSSGVADITMKEAVEYLSNEDPTYQHCGASFIQHNTFIHDASKEEVSKLNGVRPLVALLRSPSSQVSNTAAAALRNLSFKSEKNKEEMQRCGGIADAVAALKDTDSVEEQKQLTGLLWNLSSAESLKPDLLKTALPVLVERVILPYTTGPNRTNPNTQDPDVFFHTTGCLRNLSSAKQSSRQTMRKCRGLIDSLTSYVHDRVDAGKPDDESLENCVCILHNLTFQLEAEAPALFSRITALANIANRNSSQSSVAPVGCFSPQNKAAEPEPHFDFPVIEESQPSGAGWLIHSKTLQDYLTLLSTSKRDETQEACCGALQNLTTHDGIISSVMSQTVVQKLNGLKTLSPLIKSEKVNLQRNIVNLVGNLSKNPSLHNPIARKALPELLSLLSQGTTKGNESDDTLAMACQTSSCMFMKKPDISKGLLSNGLIRSLSELSQNKYFPKSSKAAALLLHNLWSHKDLQTYLKKQGMNKSAFVNDVTTAAHRLVQVID